MRWLTLVLAALLVLLQYPLWLGKGGWLKVWDTDRQLNVQKTANQQLEMRNAGLDAEVRDLKQGFEAIEERARVDLGMVRDDEVFVQIIEPRQGGASAGVNAANAPQAANSKNGAVPAPATPGGTPGRTPVR